MALYKITAEYGSVYGFAGFTESWFVDAANNDAAVSVADTINTARMALLHEDIYCYRIKASAPGNPRDSSAQRPITRVGTYEPAVGEVASPPWDSLLTNLVVADARALPRRFRAFPELAFTTTTGNWTSGWLQVAVWNTFVTTLVAAAVKVYVKDYLNPPNKIALTVTHVEPIRLAQMRTGVFKRVSVGHK